MELWYTEEHTPDVRMSIRVERQYLSKQSRYQRIDVFASKEFGRFLTLDGLMMLTEKDEYIYHDMIVHVAMATNPDIRQVLVIGAGDGGSVRELTRYDGVERIDMVEIDKEVVDACRQYLPQTACKLDDPRVRIFYEDGLKYIRRRENEYDRILVNQHECSYYEAYAQNMRRAHKRISELFPVCRVYQAHIPTYPSGHWLFGFASKKFDPLQADTARWEALGLHTKYYNTDIHRGCFALPTYVKEQLENADE